MVLTVSGISRIFSGVRYNFCMCMLTPLQQSWALQVAADAEDELHSDAASWHVLHA